MLGLAEVMNFPGVVAGETEVLDKLRVFRDVVVDGHCPGLSGRALQAYVAAGIGSDHECTTVEEAEEKLRLGMVIFIREATNARNLRTLLPLVTPPTITVFASAPTIASQPICSTKAASISWCAPPSPRGSIR